jgi:hypothetical protein
VVWFDGWCAVSRDRPLLSVAYVRAVLSGSDLWVKCESTSRPLVDFGVLNGNLIK